MNQQDLTNREDLDLSAADAGLERFALHTESQQRLHLAALIALLAIALAPYLLMPRDSFLGDLAAHTTIELIGGLFGMCTGFALILRFYTLGNRYHLLIGLAFFITGIEDLMHLRFWMGDLANSDPSDPASIAHFLLPLTYVTGQLLMGLTLVLALVLPTWVRAAPNRKQEAIRGAVIVLALTVMTAALVALPILPTVQVKVRSIRAVDVLALAALTAAFAGYLARYHRSREMLDWWITASIGVNAVGQFLMLASDGPYDAYFVLAHLYKVVGYMIPLVGFFLYQVVVVLEYDRNRRDLLTAREEALAAARAKSEFLANMSHEIRTPMNGVLGMTERALRTPLSTEQLEYLSAVRDSATSLLTLLDDILDFSKIEARKFSLHKVDFSMRDCLEGALSALRTSAQDKGLSLESTVAADVPDWLQGDSRRLRQVIVNLVGNAIKFTADGSIHVEVRRADSAEEPTDFVRIDIAVRDTGIGIDPAKQKVIFDAFSQADGSTTRRFGGTGLGLAISRELVEMMGGSIAVDSKLGQGSTFRFYVLLDVAHEPAAAKRRDAGRSPILKAARQARILLAEDNEINRRLTVATLTDMGHDVRLAVDGRQAVEVASTESVDLILMDLQMPIMGGLEATRRIREFEKGQSQRIPIVALTAHAMAEDRDRCLQAGMDEYLAKPVTERDLYLVIERFLGAVRPGAAPAILDADSLTATSSGIFDRARLMAQLNGDQIVFEELVELFGQQSKQLLVQLRESAMRRDGDATAEAAHKLGGSASNFHSPTVVDLARRIQTAAAQGDWELTAREIPQLVEAVKELRTALDAQCAVGT